jgi:hypothetical protein
MMLGWAIKISIISILLIMIFHYSQFCFKQDVFAKQTATNDDLKVQKYKNIISALSKQSDGKQTPQVHQSDPNQSEALIEDMSMDLMNYLNQKTTLQIDNVYSEVFQPEVVNLESIIQHEVLQHEVLHPQVLQQDSAQSETIQLEITEINV